MMPRPICLGLFLILWSVSGSLEARRMADPGKGIFDPEELVTLVEEAVKEDSNKYVPEHGSILQSRVDSTGRGNRMKSLAGLACGNAESWTVLPGDNKQIVRAKTAERMRCIMDTTVDPCDNFYEYSCGNWDKFYPLPPGATIHMPVIALNREIQAAMFSIVGAPAAPEDLPSENFLKELYHNCNDLADIEEDQDDSMRSLTDELGVWPAIGGDQWDPNASTVEQSLGKISRIGVPILLRYKVDVDIRGNKINTLMFDQADLLLRKNDYQNGLKGKAVQKMLTFSSEVADILKVKDKAIFSQDMKDVLNFEMELSKFYVPEEDRPPVSERYEKLVIEQLSQQTQFAFKAYLAELVSSDPMDFDGLQVGVFDLEYLTKMGKLTAKTDQRIIVNYIWLSAMVAFSKHFSQPFRAAAQKLEQQDGHAVTNTPRKEFCFDFVSLFCPLSLGAMFVRNYFDAAAKQEVTSMYTDVKARFAERLAAKDWISDDTKMEAQKKLAAMTAIIGYPSYNLNETELSTREFEGVTTSGHFNNVVALETFHTKRRFSLLGSPPEAEPWPYGSASTVNAFYVREANKINVLAGILQPVFFHKHFPKALNYGSIGYFLGHEITHGFDTNGREYDYQGNLRQWWDNSSLANFDERKECIVDQYSDYFFKLANSTLNGRRIVAENIADVGGMVVGMEAYQKWLENNPAADESLPGFEDFTPLQLHYLSMGQAWCFAGTEAYAKAAVKYGTYPPPPFRSIGGISNMEVFSREFQCPSCSEMNRNEDRCILW